MFFVLLLVDFVDKLRSIVDSLGLVEFQAVQTRVHYVLFGDCAQALECSRLVDGQIVEDRVIQVYVLLRLRQQQNKYSVETDFNLNQI